MKAPKDTYPNAFVPEHLTRLSIEKLPFDAPYYVSPGERDDYDPPVVFVDPERRLKMSKTHAIDMDDAYPASPIGLVGVMKTYLIDPSTNDIQVAYVADLRFLEDHQLIDSEDISSDLLDQEEYMHWLAELANTIEFSAFIAPEKGAEIDDDVPRGSYYGNPLLHSSLDLLRKKSNKRMKKFMKREAKPVKKQATNKEENEQAQEKKTSLTAGDPKH